MSCNLSNDVKKRFDPAYFNVTVSSNVGWLSIDLIGSDVQASLTLLAPLFFLRINKLDWHVKRVSRISRCQRTRAGVVSRRCLTGVRDRVIKRLA